MEEILEQQNEENQEQMTEPFFNDNSQAEEKIETISSLQNEEGKSIDPSQDLILGKFKNVDELTKAYSELQKFQGQNSQELGELRKESNSVQALKTSLENVLGMKNSFSEDILSVREKYNQPEYFQNQTFRELFKEAYIALNGNLDSDKFINLLESYVGSRLNAFEKSKSANIETQRVLDSMTYSKNPKQEFIQPKKSLDEMTPKEIDDLIEKLI